MRQPRSFTFQAGNVKKLLAIPLYALGWLLAWVVPRSGDHWVFGSGIGPVEGALALAQEVSAGRARAQVIWLAGSEDEAELARSQGFRTVSRASFMGFWATLRARYVVVTHGFGDVNRYAVFRALVVNLWHGAPLKRLHFDADVTTDVPGPPILRRLLTRMYRSGTSRMSLVTAGSTTAARRLRSAFRVQPGIVQVTGDPRLDELAMQLQDRRLARDARRRLLDAAGVAHPDDVGRIVLYAPTWRDGRSDPALPSAEEQERLREWVNDANVTLIIRSHPLGRGAYDDVARGHDRIRLLPADRLPDLSSVLSGIDVLVTDYSSVAIDFALTGRPIVWFAPDLATYEHTRGLYEPYEVTTEGHWVSTWDEAMTRVERLIDPRSANYRAASLRTKRLASRYHAHPGGGASRRVLEIIDIIDRPDAWASEQPSVFFESFYGRLVTCNPAALDREIARAYPELRRFWSVVDEEVALPDGAIPVLVGGPQWHAVRRHAQLLIVNDWLRFRFRRRRHQFVLQTWHGTPLKRLALDRDGLSWRTRIAIRRESHRWSAVLSQNEHATQTLSRAYRFRGPVLEVGYPRNDRLARSVSDGTVIPTARHSARQRLGLDQDARVLLYAPTWREHAREHVDTIGLECLVDELAPDWVILARGHSRLSDVTSYQSSNSSRLIDVTGVDDVNDLILAADVFVTDYSSLMFDVSVACVPMLFIAADLAAYQASERGFTLPFESIAPGPLVSNRAELVRCLEDPSWVSDYRRRAEEWRARFNPWEDGRAGARTVAELERLGALPNHS